MRIPSVDDLKSRITESKGFANPALYYVVLPTRNLSGSQKQNIEFFVRSVQLPSRSLLTIQRDIHTDRNNVAYGYANPAITMTFRVLNDQLTRSYIEDWQNSIVSRYNEAGDGHHAIAYPDDYQKQIQIFQLDRGRSFPGIDISKTKSVGGIINANVGASVDIVQTGRVVYRWDIHRAFPTNFTQEQFSDDKKNTISEISVEFTYQHWKGTAFDGKRSTGIDASASVSTDVGQKIGKKVYDKIGDFNKKLGKVI